MDFKNAKDQWQKFGEQDPLYAVLSLPEQRGNKWDEKVFFQSGQDEIDLLSKELEETNVKSKDFNNVLDFGCGVGRLSRALGKISKKVVGIDVAASMTELAKKYNADYKNIEFVLNENPNLEILGDQKFDLIYSNITLQHIPDKYSRVYIKEFMRLLEKGGVAVFQIPNERRIFGWLKQKDLSFGRRVKNMIRWTIPNNIYEHWHRFKKKDAPIMELYCVPDKEVRTIIEENGGEVLDAVLDTAAPEFVGRRYYVRKSQ